MTNIQVLENGVTIYWDETEQKPAPRAANPNRVDSYVKVSCPGCNETRFIRAHNALKASLCRHCQTSVAGSIGYRKMIATHGKATAQKKVLENCSPPSWAEEIVAEWLEHDGFSHTRQFVFDTNPTDDAAPWFVLDFKLRWGTAAIEVNGWGHKLEHKIARDARLAAHWKGKLLTVTTDEIRTDARAAREKIRKFCLNAHFDAWMES